MSNTSEALGNIAILRSYNGPASKLNHWLALAAEHLPKDIVLPEHIIPRVDLRPGELVLMCDRCSMPCPADSVAQAADFRDRHYHCGEDTCEAWRCTTCDYWEFAFQTTCRFCHASRDPDGPTGVLTVDMMLSQYATYDIFLPGRQWRACIKCNSLLRAQRAARAMYRGRCAEVRCAFGSWSSGD